MMINRIGTGLSSVHYHSGNATNIAYSFLGPDVPFGGLYHRKALTQSVFCAFWDGAIPIEGN
jgi:hypothetical protein